MADTSTTDPALVGPDYKTDESNQVPASHPHTAQHPAQHPSQHSPEHQSQDQSQHLAQHSPDQQPDASTPNKERHSLTLDQRRALRRWANSQSVRPSHKDCIGWFYSHYGQQISQSTVSHSLSPKYSRLDGDNPQLSGSRLRYGNWPDVEKLVLRWYQQVQATGRQPTNEELGEKAKSIFNQLPRYREEQPPEFSPGWIHRFKKRYNLLVRRQRRHGEGGINPAEDINYLADCVPRFMGIAPDTSPAAIKEQILRAFGVEPTLNTCALVRDEIIRRLSTGQDNAHPISSNESTALPPPQDQPIYAEDDPEVVLQNALRQLQEEEQAAEEQAAAVREERDRMSLPRPAQRTSSDVRYGSPPGQDMAPDITLTSIHTQTNTQDIPLRCPFCVNQRILRTVKEAVEHMSTHVVV